MYFDFYIRQVKSLFVFLKNLQSRVDLLGLLLGKTVNQAYLLSLIETQLVPHDFSHTTVIDVLLRKLLPRLVALQDRRKRCEIAFGGAS